MLLTLLVACDPGGGNGPTEHASQPAAVVPTGESTPSELPAADPAPPTLQAFAKHARGACANAAATVAAAPLRRDPYATGATARDRRAAEAHYRAQAQAWAAMAGDLWQFGLPRARLGRRFMTQLDRVAQYAQQAADLLAEPDMATAQISIGWTAEQLRKADRLAAKLGVSPLAECGAARRRFDAPAVVRVRATDFTFTGPRLRRGRTRFVLRNAGSEDHQLFVVPLRRAGTLQRAVAADMRSQRPGRFLAGKGRATRVAAPGARATVDMVLRPGPVALLCFVASPDGTPHAYKGMAVEAHVR